MKKELLVIQDIPQGCHGRPGSTRAHKEIIALVDNSENFKNLDKVNFLGIESLRRGSKSLPKDFN